MVSTCLKNISQNGNVPQVGVKITKYWKPPPRLVFRGVLFVRVFLGDFLQEKNNSRLEKTKATVKAAK